MTDLLLGISPEYLYYKGKQPRLVSELHHPYFLAFAPSNTSTNTARKNLVELWEKNKNDHPKLSKIVSIGEIEQYRSFCDFSKTRDVFKVFTKESYLVPEISDHLFFEHDLFTAEHDVPYQQRALVDLAAADKAWIFDTKGEKIKLKVLAYDIETTQFEEGKTEIPVDIIGQACFELCIESEKNLGKEEFRFDIWDAPSHWKDVEVTQYLSHNTDEEMTHLGQFCKTAMDCDIISGHNIVGFDNVHVQGRINWLLKNKQDQLSTEEKKLFQSFVTQYTREDKSFHFGIMGAEVVQFYPSSFDTYLAARKFYPWLDDFRLKSLAPFLNVMVEDRVYLAPSQIKLDERTMKYNKQDVHEQIGLTLHFIQQALPLSFTTCMPFDTVLSSGAVNMWDHMALLRGAAHKKIIPPICRVKSISQAIVKEFGGNLRKEELVKKAKTHREQLSKDFVRVLKYGEEMPDWVQYPYVIYKDYAGGDEDEEIVNYHMPGGMTIKPDKEALSHFIPWYYVVVADVGAMYPTILKAMNIGGDTVRLAKKNETPDAWVWLKKLPEAFFKNNDVNWREITKQDSYADKGYMIGIRIDIKPGVVNCAMTGIMSVIGKLKKELKDAQAKAHKSEVERLKMMYQSMKGARNAGSVDFAQRIILQNPQGNLINIPIGEFVNNSIQKYGYHTETFKGTEFEVADVKENWMAVSVNREGKTQLKPVRKAVRHRWEKKLVKITTKSGFTVVTPNHSIFTLKNNKLVELSAEAITNDSLIVHAEKIPRREKPHTINLIHEITAPGFKGKKESFGDCYAIPPKTIEYIDPTNDYVYDISVEENENFLDANGGILLHNTHGILAAPTVTGRQFNLWGAAAITTKGQMILADTLAYLKERNIRVVYGDTDGIYLGCSKSIGNIPELSKALDEPVKLDEKKWITKPEVALAAIRQCNTKWQEELKYPDFELEAEQHDAMIFVKHKNYLIFDTKNGKIELTTKGNNFKGSDKANIARKVLEEIMIAVLKDVPYWENEEDARNAVKNSIKNRTKEIVSRLDLSTVDLNDLTLVQSVQPEKRYKLNQDGSSSIFGKRSEALENLLGQPIRSRVKMKFVITKKPLPGIAKPSKSGVKPIDYMYPVDLVKDRKEIDLDWYKKMIENYIQGAFGLSDFAATEQTGLDAWM